MLVSLSKGRLDKAQILAYRADDEYKEDGEDMYGNIVCALFSC